MIPHFTPRRRASGSLDAIGQGVTADAPLRADLGPGESATTLRPRGVEGPVALPALRLSMRGAIVLDSIPAEVRQLAGRNAARSLVHLGDLREGPAEWRIRAQPPLRIHPRRESLDGWHREPLLEPGLPLHVDEQRYGARDDM